VGRELKSAMKSSLFAVVAEGVVVTFMLEGGSCRGCIAGKNSFLFAASSAASSAAFADRKKRR
jgi:hypothetical protein